MSETATDLIAALSKSPDGEDMSDVVARGQKIPTQYRERCDSLIAHLENGEPLYDAMEEVNLTEVQLALCMRRDAKFKSNVEEVTLGLVETINRIRSDAVKTKAFELSLKGEVTERRTRVDKDGNEEVTEKRKFPERLMLAQIAAGDGAFRTIMPETAGSGLATVTLNVSGFNPAILSAKIKTGPDGATTEIDLAAKPKEEVKKAIDVEDVTEVRNNENEDNDE